GHTLETERHRGGRHRAGRTFPAGRGGDRGRPEAQQPGRAPGPRRVAGAGLRARSPGGNRLPLRADRARGRVPVACAPRVHRRGLQLPAFCVRRASWPAGAGPQPGQGHRAHLVDDARRGTRQPRSASQSAAAALHGGLPGRHPPSPVGDHHRSQRLRRSL
ncbi:MAG: Nudix-like NDP and NTP phosphohydrolase NudJ, partial [uncultured Ramlibacter sp.]